jgi:hypothetical protein
MGLSEPRSDAARAAAAYMCQVGVRNHLATAIMNLAGALLMTGDWDAAEAELAHAFDGDGLADIELLACYRAWLAALLGEAVAAQRALPGLPDLRVCQPSRIRRAIAIAEAFTVAACRETAASLGFARALLGHAGAVGISHEYLPWVWPLAARLAHELSDRATTTELLALLDGNARSRRRWQPRPVVRRPSATAQLLRAPCGRPDGSDRIA